MTDCICCGVPLDAPASTVRHVNGSACQPCVNHATATTLQQLAEHRTIWQRFLAARDMKHQDEIADLTQQLNATQQQLQARPVRDVERVIGADELNAARDEADRAFRSRDNAWRALVEIRMLHNDDDETGQCRCGQPIGKCEVARIANYRGVIEWEHRQVERIGRDQPHELPPNHPAVLDRRRMSTAGDPTEPQPPAPCTIAGCDAEGRMRGSLRLTKDETNGRVTRTVEATAEVPLCVQHWDRWYGAAAGWGI